MSDQELQPVIDKTALAMGLLGQIQRDLIELREAMKGDEYVLPDQSSGGGEDDRLRADGSG
jgi:hypothetical protein